MMLLHALVAGFLLFTTATALKIAAALNVIEYVPAKLAISDFANSTSTSSSTISNGGVATIVSDTSIDLATNAETQALRQYATHKNLRIIYTMVEVPYRLVALKSKVKTLADLKGKKIGTFQSTSAAYFVDRMTASAGLKSSDYTIVNGNVCSATPCGSGTFPAQLKGGQVDAVGMWEPSVQLTIDTIGADNLVVFQDKSVYREIFNLHSTSDKLANPTTRAQIVDFVRSLIKAENEFISTPSKVYGKVAQAVSVDEKIIEEVWPVHLWNNGTLPSDMLDVLVQEDQWVAGVDRRSAMSRDVLAGMIDSTVLADALKGI